MADVEAPGAPPSEEPASRDTQDALAGSMGFWEFFAASAEATAEEPDTTTPAENPLHVLFYGYAPDGSPVKVDELGWMHRLDGPILDDERGREWRVHGQLHRLDGPALEMDDGAWEWRRRGQPHRADGPAIRRADGTLEWWVDGLPHRDDGPSCIEADGPATGTHMDA